MKHNVPDTMKFRKLQRRLGVSRVVAVGTLELLWITAQRNAPRGDIGKFTNEEIAIELDWEGDPDALVEALIDTGWLDRCSTHRLLIHDWRDHAPRYVHGIVSKQGGFATSTTIVHDYSPPLQSPTVPTNESDCTRQQPNLALPNETKPNEKRPQKSEDKTPAGSPSPSVASEPPKPRGRILPTLKDVKAYCAERRSHIDPVQFFDHYQANGWVQGKNKPIKDWQAAVRTWERNEFGQAKRQEQKTATSNAHPPATLTGSKARFQLLKVFGVDAARDWDDQTCVREYLSRAGPKKPPAPQVNQPDSMRTAQ